VTVRRATAADVEAIAAVHVASWKEAYPGLVPQEYLDALRAEDRVAPWRATLETQPWPVVLVLEEDGTMVGFAAVSPTRDDDLDHDAVGEVQAIYLDPSAWGRRQGDVLMKAALDELRAGGFTSACLWMLAVNDRARRFYERLGWAPDGVTKRHDWVHFVATDARFVRAL